VLARKGLGALRVGRAQDADHEVKRESSGKEAERGGEAIGACPARRSLGFKSIRGRMGEHGW